MKEKLKNLYKTTTLYIKQKFYHIVYYQFWLFFIYGSISQGNNKIVVVLLIMMIVTTPYIYWGMSPTFNNRQINAKEAIEITFFRKQNYILLFISIIVFIFLLILLTVVSVSFKTVMSHNLYVSFGFIIFLAFFFKIFKFNLKNLKIGIKKLLLFIVIMGTLLISLKFGTAKTTLIFLAVLFLYKIVSIIKKWKSKK